MMMDLKQIWGCWGTKKHSGAASQHVKRGFPEEYFERK